MIDKLKLIHRDYHSCEEDIIETVCNALGRSCEKMYCHAWNFEYIKSCETIGKRLYEGENDVFNNIKLYHGIEFKEKSNCSVDSVDEMIIKGVVNVPFVCYIDNIQYPWISTNRLFKRTHPILITEITADEWFCMDPYMQAEKVKLEKKYISKCSMRMQTIVVNELSSDLKGFDTFVFDSAYKIRMSQEHMNLFVQDMYNLNKLDDEIMIYKSHVISDLLDHITYIARRRMQYAKYISYLTGYTRSNMTSCITAFEELSREWQTIGKKLLKIYCTNSWNMEKSCFCKLIESVLEDEVENANVVLRLRRYEYENGY